MIFGKLNLEPIVQIEDKTRLEADSSFISVDEAAITLVEIEPFSGNGFIDVTGTSSRDWHLDWSYQGGVSRTETVTLRITTDGAPVTFTKDIELLSEADDKLFSSDSELIKHEPDCLKWIIDGRNTFLDIHRRAQTLILDWFDNRGFRITGGAKVTKDHIINIDEVREWSTFMVLKIIMASRSNAIDDIFADKAAFYDSRMIEKRERVFISYDWNNDGDIDPGEENMRMNMVEVERT